MRILQLIHDRERGGVQKLAAMIEAGLRPQRFEIETAYLYPRAGVPFYTKFLYALRAAQQIWRGEYDALIAYQSTASILAGFVGALAGCRLRVVHQTCMPGETARPLRLMDKLAGTLGLYSANIVNSAATWAAFARHPKRYRRAMLLIEHGLDAPVAAHDRVETRRRFDLPLRQPLLLNVGRLAEQKNQDVLIRALACLPQAHLVLAGAGPQRDAFHELAVTLGVDDRLHMLGALLDEDIADLYAAADLFVFPSTWETFGLAAIEAAMAGLPMVAADLPVLREVLRGDGSDRVTFVKPHDLEGWISAIGHALTRSPAARIANAFARGLASKYSKSRMIESYVSLFAAQVQRERNEVGNLPRTAGEMRP